MATLVSASVPLVQSLGISRGISKQSQNCQHRWSRSRKASSAAKACRCRSRAPENFRRSPGHLLAVGEETGQLDTMFTRMADIYETETRSAIRRFTSLFEPLIILVMGMMVGRLILSLMLAITSINDVAM